MQELECCFINEQGEQCSQKARFWVGKNGIDNYVHACGDHVEDLKADGDLVEEL